MAKTNTTRTVMNAVDASHSPEARHRLPIAPERLKLERFDWGEIYTGSKAALIAGGHAAEGQFPGDPNRGSTMCSYHEDGTPSLPGKNGRPAVLTVRRYGKGFKLQVIASADEQQRRRDERAIEAEWRESADEADAEVERCLENLAEMPATGPAFAKRGADLFWASFQIFWNVYGEAKHRADGYRFSAADQAMFFEMASSLHMEISRAEPMFDRVHRMRQLTDARVKAAKADLPLQRLLAWAASASPARRLDE